MDRLLILEPGAIGLPTLSSRPELVLFVKATNTCYPVSDRTNLDTGEIRFDHVPGVFEISDVPFMADVAYPVFPVYVEVLATIPDRKMNNKEV